MDDSREMLAEIASEVEALHDTANDTERRLAEIEQKLDRVLAYQRAALIDAKKGS